MSTRTRQLSNIQGVNVGLPTQTGYSASNLEVYANDAAFVTAHPSPAQGSLYWNSTEKTLREFNGTSWQYDKIGLSTQTDSTTTGANQDITPANDQIIRFTQGSLSSIRGIVAGIQRVVWLINDQAAQSITIQNEAAGATAANRITVGNGQDFVLAIGQIICLAYDSATSRWRPIFKLVNGQEAFASDAAYTTAHAPVAGATYWNTTDKVTREYDGTNWGNVKVMLSNVVDSSSTGSAQDITPAYDQAIHFTSGTLVSIRGIIPTLQRFLCIANDQASQVLTILNQDATATAANRIITGTGLDLSLAYQQSIFLQYDEDAARWRVVGGTGSSSGGSSGFNQIAAASQSSAINWGSSGGTAASTTTTAAELPLGPVITSAIKYTRTVAAGYDYYRWTQPAAADNTVIPITGYQLTESGYVSGDFKLDLYVNAALNYGGAYTRKALRSDVAGVTAIPVGNGYFGGGNICSYDSGTDRYYELRVVRVTGTKFLSFALWKAGPGDTGIANSNGASSTFVPTITNGGPTSTNTGTVRQLANNLLEISYWTVYTAAGSAAALEYSMPSGYTMDVNGMAGGFVAYAEGNGTYFNATNFTAIQPYPISSTKFRLIPNAGTNDIFGNALASGHRIGFKIVVPVVELLNVNPIIVGPGNTPLFYISPGNTWGTTNASAATAQNPGGILGGTTTPSGTGFSYTFVPTVPVPIGMKPELEISVDGIHFSPLGSVASGNIVEQLRFDGTNYIGAQAFLTSAGNIQVLFGKYCCGTSTAWSGVWYWRVLVANPSIPGGVYVATGGQGAGMINYYNEDDTTLASCTFQGSAGGSASSGVAIKITRIGRIVTLDIPSLISAVPTGGSLALYANTLLPTWARPPVARAAPCFAYDNGAFVASQSGQLFINTTGRIEVYRNIIGTAFTNSANAGWYTMSISYSV